MIIIGDSTAVDQRLSHDIWSKGFSNAVNLGIEGDRMEILISRSSDLSLPALFKNTVIHCGTDNINRYTTYDFPNIIIWIDLLFIVTEIKP